MTFAMNWGKSGSRMTWTFFQKCLFVKKTFRIIPFPYSIWCLGNWYTVQSMNTHKTSGKVLFVSYQLNVLCCIFQKWPIIDIVPWVTWRKGGVIVLNPLLWTHNIKTLFSLIIKILICYIQQEESKARWEKLSFWKVMYGFGLCLDLDCQRGLYSGHILSLECRGFTLFLIFSM